MNPFVSVCMIVKNEEKVIERCLSSIAHLVDEVIIVDTGSTDSTKEIAAKFTSNIYHFDWVNDFSAARNFAASKANGKWILVLDADEYLDEDNLNSFINELKNVENNIEAFTAKILNFTGRNGEVLIQNYHDRVYKNTGDISYYRKIHEQFRRNDNKPMEIKNSSLVIFHSGYLNQTVKEKEKGQRNKELLDQEIKNNNNQAFDFFNFGNEYYSIGEYSKALDSYLEAYKLKKDFRLSWVSTTLIQIIFCLMQLKRYNEALEVIRDAETIYSTSPEFPFLKGEIFYLRGQIDDAQKVFQEIIDQNDQFDHIIFRPDLKDQVPHRRLGEIHFYKKDYQKAIYNFVAVLNLNKHCEVSIQNVITILSKHHQPEEITTFLVTNNLLNESNLKNYVRVCFDVGNPRLALLLIEEYKNENQLLYTIARLKNICINEVYDEDLSSIFNQKMIMDLNISNWLDIIDLYLLSKIEKLNIHFKFLEENNDFIQLVELIEGNKEVETKEELFLFSLKRLLYFKQFELCDMLLKKIGLIPSKSVSKVAAILFESDFKAEALHLYEKSELSTYSKQDFVNIIESLLQTNHKPDAVNYAQYAISIYNDDFRFYKYIIENSNQNSIGDILQIAKTKFTNSYWLEYNTPFNFY